MMMMMFPTFLESRPRLASLAASMKTKMRSGGRGESDDSQDAWQVLGPSGAITVLGRRSPLGGGAGGPSGGFR